MMKKFFFIMVLMVCSLPALARHVSGGELMYEYIGPGADGNSSQYKITLRLFRDSLSTGPQLNDETPIVGFYVNGTKVPVLLNGVSLTDIPLPLVKRSFRIALNTGAFPCLVGNVSATYDVALFSAVVTVPNNREGYTLSTLGCCRVDLIDNLNAPIGRDGSASVGNNYVTFMPGTRALGGGMHNSSPVFNLRDTALVCALKKFKLDFGATDADKDSLTYSFCDAFTSGLTGRSIPPTAQLTLIPLPYASPFNGSSPLGATVTINPSTGIISGIAPAEGKYVVNVCITEWRNGVAISELRNDLVLIVQSCDIVEADLPDRIVQCRDSLVRFENGSLSSSIIDYLWEFGDGSGRTSYDPTPVYPYADTGRYLVRLTVHGPNGCVGVDSTELFVYPGFKPDFNITGSCFLTPYQFIDQTTTKYGVVDSWRWDFGDVTTLADTSRQKNATYKYATADTRTISLIATSSKGCIDSVKKDFAIRDKPKIQLPFKDTLICSIDTLAIPVGGSGIFSWMPNRNIIGANTQTPLVFPKDTTLYIVTLNDQGCTNTDTVTVNVLDHITVQLGPDSTICQTDLFALRPVSHALKYTWSSSTGEVLNAVKYPFAKPLTNTSYYVLASLGKCIDRDTIQVRVAPYPTVTVSPDTVICVGTRVQLRSTITAAYINWTPAASLTNPAIRFPIAGPSRTTAYIATVRDTLGCPKTASDTVTITVAPPVQAFAGRDTVAVLDQPLQLQATGGVQYAWSPEAYISSVHISNPQVFLPAGVDSMRYIVRVTDRYGCFADDDVVIRLFKTGPELFVPSAFTPNGDGLNDILKPLPVGIASLKYFRVYNRYGQLIYSTAETGKGWDGMYNGVPQPPGAYVYQAEGVDYTGKTVFRKGTVVLIR